MTDFDRFQKTRFGQQALTAGYVTTEQLLDCLKIQRCCTRILGTHPRLGEIMMIRGLLTPRQCVQILKKQDPDFDTSLDVSGFTLFGEVCVELGFAGADEILLCLEIQDFEKRKRGKTRPLGTILYDRGVLTNDQVSQVLHELAIRNEGD